jgi:PelA/Pel-15E family pectate lyase
LHSGGWQNHIDFESPLREKMAYRVDGPPRKKARNWSSFDDNQTQAALRFLMTLDQTLKFQDKRLHEVVETALAGVLHNQFPSGAWAQGFDELDLTQKFPIQPARYPNDWPRKHPGGDYWRFYTLNDNALVHVLETMWLAGEIYGDQRYRQSALQAADFLILAQMPEPQPAWAQQYNTDMEPIWARKFEPPAVTGGESQQVIETLMDVATWTGDTKYLKPIEAALAYLERSQLPSGRMARFYELKTNRPLYFNRQYELTYDDNDLPTHYGFITPSKLKRLRVRYEQLKTLTSQQLLEVGQRQRQREALQSPSDDKIQTIIAAMDDRGAWIERGKMRSIKAATGEIDVISSATFIEHLDQLSRYLAARRPGS